MKIDLRGVSETLFGYVVYACQGCEKQPSFSK